MVLIYVSVKAKADTTDKFEKTLREIVDDARKTMGCTRYEWYRHPDSPQAYDVFGEFDTRDHFEGYLKSAVVKRIGAELMPLLEAPPQFKHYEAEVFKSS